MNVDKTVDTFNPSLPLKIPKTGSIPSICDWMLSSGLLNMS